MSRILKTVLSLQQLELIHTSLLLYPREVIKDIQTTHTHYLKSNIQAHTFEHICQAGSPAQLHDWHLFSKGDKETKRFSQGTLAELAAFLALLSIG